MLMPQPLLNTYSVFHFSLISQDLVKEWLSLYEVMLDSL